MSKALLTLALVSAIAACAPAEFGMVGGVHPNLGEPGSTQPPAGSLPGTQPPADQDSDDSDDDSSSYEDSDSCEPLRGEHLTCYRNECKKPKKSKKPKKGAA